MDFHYKHSLQFEFIANIVALSQTVDQDLRPICMQSIMKTLVEGPTRTTTGAAAAPPKLLNMQILPRDRIFPRGGL